LGVEADGGGHEEPDGGGGGDDRARGPGELECQGGRRLAAARRRIRDSVGTGGSGDTGGGGGDTGSPRL
jgi:hypothetical protein